jgi:hypothetical protein
VGILLEKGAVPLPNALPNVVENTVGNIPIMGKKRTNVLTEVTWVVTTTQNDMNDQNECMPSNLIDTHAQNEQLDRIPVVETSTRGKTIIDAT